MSSPKPTAAGTVPKDVIVHVDSHVVVVKKPAGIATVPYEDERDTLDRVVQVVLRKAARPGTSVAPLGVVQRLDKETSGLIVFARTTTAKRGLQQQFREHSVASPLRRRRPRGAPGPNISVTARDGPRRRTPGLDGQRDARPRSNHTCSGTGGAEGRNARRVRSRNRADSSDSNSSFGGRTPHRRGARLCSRLPRNAAPCAEVDAARKAARFRAPSNGAEAGLEQEIPLDMATVLTQLRGLGTP